MLESKLTLQESENRFRLLIEGVQDYAIFMLDPDGRVKELWNKGGKTYQGGMTVRKLSANTSRASTQKKILQKWQATMGIGGCRKRRALRRRRLAFGVKMVPGFGQM